MTQNPHDTDPSQIDDDHFQDTGDEIGRIPLGDGARISAEDDGYPDTDTIVRVRDANDDTHTLSSWFSDYRADHGDGALYALLRRLDPTIRQEEDADDDEESARLRGPPAYKCNGCNRTWPRSSNQTPGTGPDTCPECYEEEEDA